MTNYSNRGDTEGCITYKANTALKLDSFLKNQRDRKRGPFMSSLSSSLAEAWSQDHFLGFPSRWQKASHSSHRFHLLGFTLAASRNQEPDVGTKSGYFHMGAGAAILTTWLNAYSSTILLLQFFFTWVKYLIWPRVCTYLPHIWWLLYIQQKSIAFSENCFNFSQTLKRAKGRGFKWKEQGSEESAQNALYDNAGAT